MKEPKADTSSADWTTNFSVEYNFERNETVCVLAAIDNNLLPTYFTFWNVSILV